MGKPWGQGRPGWHIECSAMSLKYLGETLDIHGGGQDLIFPHHENEIAQSESFTGKKPFARYWMHNGLLQFGAEKMSKSLGNLITIKDALARYGADAIRVFILSSHYRSPLKYSEEALEAAGAGVERLRRVAYREETGGDESIDAEAYHQRFTEAMDDDFNAPQALGVLFDMARAINQAADSGKGFGKAKEMLVRLAKEVFGLKLEALDAAGGATDEIQARVEKLAAERNECRRTKQWQRADEIRDELAALGVTLEDAPEGTKIIWK